MSNGLGVVVEEMLGGPPPPHNQQIVNHSPKSCTLLSPGSVPLPGLASVAAAAAAAANAANGGSAVSNGNGYSRSIYSPESENNSPPVVPHSHVHHGGGMSSHGGGHHPPPPHRPSSLSASGGSSGTGGNSSNKSSSSTGKSGKRARWLLCYHMRGGGPGDSPSPPSENCGESQCSTPSPTDHGFRLPNSFSNERPTSLPVALLTGGGSVVAGNNGVALAAPLQYSMGESPMHAFCLVFFFVFILTILFVLICLFGFYGTNLCFFLNFLDTYNIKRN